MDKNNQNHDDGSCFIYGIDICKIITPEMARDAIIRCFTLAHSKELEVLKEYEAVNGNNEKFEELKKLDVEILIKKTFEDVGGDFNYPTKESLKKVVSKLTEFAKNFRDPGVIKKHYEEAMMIINKIAD